MSLIFHCIVCSVRAPRRGLMTRGWCGRGLRVAGGEAGTALRSPELNIIIFAYYC